MRRGDKPKPVGYSLSGRLSARPISQPSHTIPHQNQDTTRRAHLVLFHLIESIVVALIRLLLLLLTCLLLPPLLLPARRVGGRQQLWGWVGVERTCVGGETDEDMHNPRRDTSKHPAHLFPLLL